MLTLPPVKYPRRRRRVKPQTSASAAPPPGPLTLVSATYDIGAGVNLTFDRAIDIAAIDVAQFSVNDGAFAGFRYEGTGPALLLSATTVQVPLVGIEEWSSPDVRFDASTSNGIVAAGDGNPWAGTNDLELPFP